MTPKEYLENKKVLVMGLGTFGGGVATAKWLLRHGAIITITDLRTPEELVNSIKQFSEAEIKKITFILGRHRKNDFKSHDLIVVNPGVPKESSYLTIAKKHTIKIVSETSLFFTFAQNPIIAVTGTRGKTTSTNWISTLISTPTNIVIPSGNTPKNALLKELTKTIRTTEKPSVTELSSWQLELLPEAQQAPHIAVITNLYPDHLNRYKNIKEYARAKANIFKHQNSEDFLILNYTNEWTPFFISLKPQAKLFFFSLKKLPKNINGLFLDQNNNLIFQEDTTQKTIININDFEKNWGRHNIENVCVSILAALLFNPFLKITKNKFSQLQGIPLRQEIIYTNSKLTIVNDSAGTSPDALISAIERFKNNNLILICGGTDKKLIYKEASLCIKKNIKVTNCIFLNSSGTIKLLKELKKIKYFEKEKPLIYEDLTDGVDKALTLTKEAKNTILFSPGGSSFEKFKNEFDRGTQFNKYIKKYYKNI